MNHDFPLRFTLDDGTEVTVNKSDRHRYEFTLKSEEGGGVRHFVYNEEEEFTDAKEKALTFDELNALRRFWLETRDE